LKLVPGTLMDTRQVSLRPCLSICVQQYDRTNFLMRAIISYAEQAFRDFEVCISDDQSPDGRQGEAPAGRSSNTHQPYTAREMTRKVAAFFDRVLKIAKTRTE
jgi:hypothetical protein